MSPPSLTPREQETLQAVARRLTNAEIAREFGLSVRTVESHIASLRRKLFAESRGELIRAAQGYAGRPVPAPTNSFIGGDESLAELGALLEETRWVTVTGLPGVGKSRLAVEAARLRPSVLVDLHDTPVGGELAAVASALGLTAATAPSLVQACGVALSTGPLVLFLDNADRVAEKTGKLVGELLGRVQTLSVVITSRAPLHGAGETVLELRPLASRRPTDPGVALFVDRVRAASRATDVSDMSRVLDICRRLEGVPLAIELAAARTRHLSLAELERRLETGYEALGARESGGTALGATFAWSWDLLDADSRSVLAHLAALPRCFDLDLAASVLGRRVDNVVLDLLDRSLLTGLPGRAEAARYKVPGALGEFVRSRDETAVGSLVAQRHAAHHLPVANLLASQVRTDDRPQTREAAAAAYPEIAAALSWAIAHDDPASGELAASLAVGIEQYGPDPSAMRALIAAAETPGQIQRWSPPALVEVGRALALARLDLVDELAARARSLVGEGAAEVRLSADLLTASGLVHRDRAAQALPVLQRAVALARELEDPWTRADALQLLAKALHRLGETPTEALLRAFEAARDAYAEAGDSMHVNNTHYMMASVAATDPAWRADAVRWAEQCIDYAVRHGNELELGHARLAHARALPDQSAAELAEAVRLLRRAGDLRCLSRALLEAAEPQGAQRREELLREAVHVGAASGDPRCHRAASLALASFLEERGHRAEAAAVLGVAPGPDPQSLHHTSAAAARSHSVLHTDASLV
ncbi:MAG: hypothetical protein H6526_06675 [Actinobacteria bacterium]|nr:hypothetical protein [Actinomycetota bacterium]HRY09508.1 LuxR C-terminal-related transcriptional regulator [Candidatus Nanopelagicales bacterium]